MCDKSKEVKIKNSEAIEYTKHVVYNLYCNKIYLCYKIKIKSTFAHEDKILQEFNLAYFPTLSTSRNATWLIKYDQKT